MKSWWKGRKRRKLDKKMRDDFISAIGIKPTDMVFNKTHKYWELFWEDEDTDNYLQLKVGISLAQAPEGSEQRVNIVWVYFHHPAAYGARISPYALDSAGSAIELIMECRDAIRLLKYEG